jgi:hypothetical protein
MIRFAASDPLYPYILVALWVFLAFFVCVSLWLTYDGWRVAKKIRTSLAPKP